MALGKMIKRRKTIQVSIGKVKVGGAAPVSIQSMTKVDTSDVGRVVSEIRRLEDCGCEIVRVAIKNMSDAKALREIKKKTKIPIVCDIHFDHRLALQCISAGADKIRLNPGNIKKPEEIVKVIKAAKARKIPIRIGVNSGSVSSGRRVESDMLVDSVVKYLKVFEDQNFRDIIISLKASNVVSTVNAYRSIAKRCDYPLHLGITASGPSEQGIVKSSIGIGSLLLDGIGDTIRVSLTADPADEVASAKRILSAIGLRSFGPDIISCPTCGRCQIDLINITQKVDDAIRSTQYAVRKSDIKVAIMGCEVNGPGEAREADIGIAAGKGCGVLFVKGKIVKKIKTKDFVPELLKELKKL